MLRYWYFILVCLFSASLAMAQPQYTLIPLEGMPQALDPSGPLVAIGAAFGATPGSAEQPAYLTEAGPVFLGLLPGGSSGRGEGICGAYATGTAQAGVGGFFTHAWRTTAGEAGLEDLGDGARYSAGRAVNCQGIVAGVQETTDGDFRIEPVWWDVEGTIHLLPTLQATGTSTADAINEAGDIAGSAAVGVNAHCAWWPADTGAIQDCLVDPAGKDFSYAMFLNNRGHLGGTFFLVGNPQPQRGFLREPSGAIVLLNPVEGEAMSMALDMNDAGLVVGSSSTDPERANLPGTARCTLWQDDDRDEPPIPVALDTLVTNGAGWTLRRCLGVNAGGVILGSGTLNGVTTAFLAIPTVPVAQVPPPAVAPQPTRHGKRRTKAQHGPMDLAKILAHWQERLAQSQDKVARWEAARDAWKKVHGR